MYIEQLYTDCLAEAAYYIESAGEAVIIDPMRETKPYLDLAKKRNAKIKYVLETHFHADFVSGHLDISRVSGATIVFGPEAKPDYAAHIARDGEEIFFGKLTIKVLHTPGHTPESSCYLLLDENKQPYALFSGDTLFVGEVGRPDLAVKSTLSKEDLAAMLYDSLHTKIKMLPDAVILYPAHGAGSSCGKNIGKESYSTIGLQKQLNYALQDMSKEEFVRIVLDGLAKPPAYFFIDASINKKGYERIEDVISRNTQAISVATFEKELTADCILLDTREPDVFEKGYIPGSINIGLNGQYAQWVGALLDHEKKIMLVTEIGKEHEAVLRLARVGYEKVRGYLDGGIQAWKNAGKRLEVVEGIDPIPFASSDYETLRILDVRNPAEWESGIIKGATLISLPELNAKLDKLDKQAHYYVHCAGGYRSMMAASLLKKNGFQQVTNVRGGINKLKACGIMLTSAVLK